MECHNELRVRAEKVLDQLKSREHKRPLFVEFSGTPKSGKSTCIEIVTHFFRRQDMSRFLQKSELTERRAFIETFVKEIELLPDNAVVRYSVPMPDDSLIPGKKVQEIPLNGSVVSSVNGSPPDLTKSRTFTLRFRLTA